MRTINADALIEKWCAECDNRGFCNEEVGWCNDVKDVYDMPTIEAEPKHGHWVDVYDNNGHHQVCSECGEWRYHNKQIYCGICGAKMYEVEE